MKNFVFALVAFLFTSFVFALPPTENNEQKVEKIEFVKQLSDQAITFTAIEQTSFDFVISQRKTVQSYGLFMESISITEQRAINFNPKPCDNYKSYDYTTDLRNWCRIQSKNKMLI